MSGQIVQDNDVVWFQTGDENPLDIRKEDFAIHGAVDDERSDDAIVAQSGKKRCCLPVSVGNFADDALSARAAGSRTRKVGGHSGFVKKNQACLVQRRLPGPPFFAGLCHVWPVLLAGVFRFF